MSDDTQPMVSPADRLAQIKANLSSLLQDGFFVADMEQCDEDRSLCPTGGITFVYNHPGPDGDAPIVTAGWFSESEDAVYFVQLIKDCQWLVEQMQLQRDVKYRIKQSMQRLEEYVMFRGDFWQDGE